MRYPLKCYPLKWCCFVLLMALAVTAKGQNRSFRILSYNVENLFDTCHDVGHKDYEFLPESSRRWDSRKYWKKQGALSRTLAAASGSSPIDLIALCEVENDSVVRDLTKRTRLYRMGYEYVVTKSKDARGIDVALLYQPERFKKLSHQSVRVPYDAAYGRSTRDILHVSGRLPNGDTLDIVVNHWPSRRGGAKATERFRAIVAQTVRGLADSVLAVRRHPYLVMMGDFNDEYANRSIRCELGAVLPDDRTGQYVILSANKKAPGGICGTYKYKGEWNQLDQMIVSRSLLEDEASLKTKPEKCRILSLPFLLEEDESRGGVKPFRTFQGPVYRGGISDHLPLLLELEW